MFWNDPNLYTAHLPYKEWGQTPFVGPQFTPPWQNIPKWVPPTTFGMLPNYDPKMMYNPYLQPQFTPYVQPQAFTPPYVQPQAFTPPYIQPYNVNPTLFNYFRPFIY